MIRIQMIANQGSIWKLSKLGWGKASPERSAKKISDFKLSRAGMSEYEKETWNDMLVTEDWWLCMEMRQILQK